MGLAIPIAKTGGLFVRLEIDGQIPKGNLCHISRMAFDITSDVYIYIYILFVGEAATRVRVKKG